MILRLKFPTEDIGIGSIQNKSVATPCALIFTALTHLCFSVVLKKYILAKWRLLLDLVFIEVIWKILIDFFLKILQPLYDSAISAFKTSLWLKASKLGPSL